MQRLLPCLFLIVLNVGQIQAATQTINTVPDSNATFLSDLQTFLEDEDANRATRFRREVISGGIGATDAGLTHTVSAVVGFVNGYYVSQAGVSHTYTASKDTFVFLRDDTARTITIAGFTITYDGYFVFAENVNSTIQPQTPVGTIALFEAVTNGTGITTINDYRSGGVAYLTDPNFDDFADAISDLGSTIPVVLVVNLDITLGGNVTVTKNIHLAFIPGNLISPNGNTLTIFSPENISAGSRQQLFATATGVAFTEPGVIYANWWDEDIDDGSAVADTTFDHAVGAAVNGSEIIVLPAVSYYNFTAALTIDKSIHFHGVETGGADIRQATAGTVGISVTVSNVEISHLKLTGAQEAALQADEDAIRIRGADASNYITNHKIHDCYIVTWGSAGIDLQFTQYTEINNNYIKDIYQYGIIGQSSLDCFVTNNTIDTVNGDGIVGTEVYGITMSKNNGALVTYPTPKRCTISHNIVKGCTTWTGIDTHAGESIVINNNQVYDCRLGIVVTRYSNAGLDIGPRDCVISGNSVVNENQATTDVGNGIQLVGHTNSYASNCMVVGNVVRNHGDSDSAGNFACSLYAAALVSCSIRDNELYFSGKQGIQLIEAGDNVNITGNSIYEQTTAAPAIELTASGGAATGIISGNFIYNTSIGFDFNDSVAFDFHNNYMDTVTTPYQQASGSIALDLVTGTFMNIARGTDTWDPALIADGASESRTISSIPGCSSLASAHVTMNRELQGLVMNVVTGDTDTSVGKITLTLRNETGGAVDLASLNLRYVVHKY